MASKSPAEVASRLSRGSLEASLLRLYRTFSAESAKHPYIVKPSSPAHNQVSSPSTEQDARSTTSSSSSGESRPVPDCRCSGYPLPWSRRYVEGSENLDEFYPSRRTYNLPGSSRVSRSPEQVARQGRADCFSEVSRTGSVLRLENISRMIYRNAVNTVLSTSESLPNSSTESRLPQAKIMKEDTTSAGSSSRKARIAVSGVMQEATRKVEDWLRDVHPPDSRKRPRNPEDGYDFSPLPSCKVKRSSYHFPGNLHLQSPHGSATPSYSPLLVRPAASSVAHGMTPHFPFSYENNVLNSHDRGQDTTHNPAMPNAHLPLSPQYNPAAPPWPSPPLSSPAWSPSTPPPAPMSPAPSSATIGGSLYSGRSYRDYECKYVTRALSPPPSFLPTPATTSSPYSPAPPPPFPSTPSSTPLANSPAPSSVTLGRTPQPTAPAHPSVPPLCGTPCSPCIRGVFGGSYEYCRDDTGEAIRIRTSTRLAGDLPSPPPPTILPVVMPVPTRAAPAPSWLLAEPAAPTPLAPPSAMLDGALRYNSPCYVPDSLDMGEHAIRFPTTTTSEIYDSTGHVARRTESQHMSYTAKWFEIVLREPTPNG